MLRILTIAVGALALAGCNTVSDAWNKPGASTAQTTRDFDECNYQVGLNSRPSYGDPVATGISDGLRERNLMNQCMNLRGYTRTAHFYAR
jgi:hypothetical protein